MEVATDLGSELRFWDHFGCIPESFEARQTIEQLSRKVAAVWTVQLFHVPQAQPGGAGVDVYVDSAH